MISPKAKNVKLNKFTYNFFKITRLLHTMTVLSVIVKETKEKILIKKYTFYNKFSKHLSYTFSKIFPAHTHISFFMFFHFPLVKKRKADSVFEKKVIMFS